MSDVDKSTKNDSYESNRSELVSKDRTTENNGATLSVFFNLDMDERKMMAKIMEYKKLYTCADMFKTLLVEEYERVNSEVAYG